MVAAATLFTLSTKHEYLLSLLIEKYGSVEPCLRNKPCLHDCSPFISFEIEEHNIVENRFCQICLLHCLLSDCVLPKFECAIILSSIDKQVIAVLNDLRLVLSPWHWPYTSLLMDCTYEKIIFMRLTRVRLLCDFHVLRRIKNNLETCALNEVIGGDKTPIRLLDQSTKDERLVTLYLVPILMPLSWSLDSVNSVMTASEQFFLP